MMVCWVGGELRQRVATAVLEVIAIALKDVTQRAGYRLCAGDRTRAWPALIRGLNAARRKGGSWPGPSTSLDG